MWASIVESLKNTWIVEGLVVVGGIALMTVCPPASLPGILTSLSLILLGSKYLPVRESAQFMKEYFGFTQSYPQLECDAHVDRMKQYLIKESASFIMSAAATEGIVKADHIGTTLGSGCLMSMGLLVAYSGYCDRQRIQAQLLGDTPVDTGYPLPEAARAYIG